MSGEGEVAEATPESRTQSQQYKTDESTVSDKKVAVHMLCLLANVSAPLQAVDSQIEDL